MSTFRQRIMENGSIHIDDVNQILKNKETVELLKKFFYILEGDTFSLEEGKAVAEAQWTGEEEK